MANTQKNEEKETWESLLNRLSFSLRGRRQNGREKGLNERARRKRSAQGTRGERQGPSRASHAHSRARFFFRFPSFYPLSIPFRRLPHRLAQPLLRALFGKRRYGGKTGGARNDGSETLFICISPTTPCEPRTINLITQSASGSTKERHLGTRQKSAFIRQT